MKCYLVFFNFLLLLFIGGCSTKKYETPETMFKYQTEQFADLRILRYQVPGFDKLPLQQKRLLYYLNEAALSGRDIIYDQNFKHNLTIRRTLETIVENYAGDRNTDEYKQFMIYTKRVWFSNGIHHHYSTHKILPEFSSTYFSELIHKSPNGQFPLNQNETLDEFIAKLTPVIFDPEVAAKRVNLDQDADLVAESANNYYEGVSQKEVEEFYDKLMDKSDDHPISYGLNSKLMKENGRPVEKVWNIDGMYGSAIEKIVYWLEKAVAVAENEKQQAALSKLIDYYKTGDLRTFDEYNIAWVQDTESVVDVINGFIEVYGDAMGYRGAFESVVSFKDIEATKRIAAISSNAQWFEDHSPLFPAHKKEDVAGISAKVITVVMEAGDASPATPIGINLPNANWIRSEHGSKSVNLGNIVNAYNEIKKGDGSLEEFAYSQEEIDRAQKYGVLASNLHTDMHEVIGHASGRINDGVGTPKETLKNYASTLEEARADLVALYFGLDTKLVKIGVAPSIDIGKAEYDSYIRNGLMVQLRRLKPGENLEESHMRNRQLIAAWAYEKGKTKNVVEKKIKNGKTYFVINDYEALRKFFGELLREVQRMKSEGDYLAAKELIENYGVKVDTVLHKEVLERFKGLNIAPYAGFINPKLVPKMEDDKIMDVKIEYPEDFTEQMLYYAQKYSFLPHYN